MRVRLVILTALYLTSGLSQQDDYKLLGKWRSVETSKGGIGAVLNFRTNNIFDYSPGAVIAGKYRVAENQVITTYDNGDPEDAMTIESLTAETLRLGAPQGAGSTNLKRVGRPEDPTNLLLGSWVTVATMPGMPSHGYYYFRKDGTTTFNIPFRTDRCTYSLAGDRIRLAVAAGGSVEGQVRWEGDVLILPWHRGEARFKRF
jgi:hypothetical protein